MLALVLFALAAASAPLAVDLDGDGAPEAVTASPSRRQVLLTARGPDGRKARAVAPGPAGKDVRVALVAGPVGSAGALLEVIASDGAAECRSVWRLREGALQRLPVRAAGGRTLPDCAIPGDTAFTWEREAEDRPSLYVRERSEERPDGPFRLREVFVFSGFGLDLDPARSRAEIRGVPIPAWYGETLYTRSALDTLRSRFGLTAMRSEPTLEIQTDRERGVFELRLAGPDGPIVAPVAGYAETSRGVTLAGTSGSKSFDVRVQLGGDGSVPYEARLTGLGAPWDQVYAPAGTWRGGARHVYPSAADELGAEYLAGLWGDEKGRNASIAIEGAPPYRVRLGKDLYAVSLDAAPAGMDVLLSPAEAAGQPFGLFLRGPNSMQRTPLVCGDGACRPDGPAELLRRIGARVNVR